MGYQRTSCWRWRLGVPKDKLLEVDAGGTKGQVAGGGGWEVPKDKLLEGEAMGYPREGGGDEEKAEEEKERRAGWEY